MVHKRVIDPLNRIEGDLAIEISVGNDNKIEDAKALGFVYRGLENIFIGKEPYDAARLSQRACGVCPVPHGVAGVMAIEDAIGFKIPKNAELVRDITMGINTVVSHATHFYFMWGPDLVNDAYKSHPMYPEIVKRFDPLKSPHLQAILKEGRIPLNTVMAIFGGKFPHPMHAVPGGVLCVPKHIELIKANTMVNEVKEFVEKNVLNGITIEDWQKVKSVKDVLALMNNPQFANSDVGVFVKLAQDLGMHKFGEGAVNNYISYGFGKNKDGSWLFKPGYLENGKYYPLDPKHIAEDTTSAYYEDEKEWRNPAMGVTKPVVGKKGAYSWIKSTRYFGHVVEAGPLARQLVQGDPLITDLVKTFGANTFTRTIARLHEILLIIPKLIEWIGAIDLTQPFYYPFPEVKEGNGAGLVEAPRGALGHWIEIEKSITKRYQIITPTTWNASPKDSNGANGTIEQALIGVQLKDKNSMLEVGHIVRAFDPCISCSVHAIGAKKAKIVIEPTR